MASENQRSFGWLALLTGLVALATVGVVAVLVNIFERKQEARKPFVRLVEVNEVSTDPEPWGVNFPLQYEAYLRTADTERTEYGGNHALPPSKLEKDPWLKRLFRGIRVQHRLSRSPRPRLHARRSTGHQTCHRRPTGRGLPALPRLVIPTVSPHRHGKDGNRTHRRKVLGEAFAQEAVIEGFRAVSQMKYEEVAAEITKTPDGTTKAAEGDPHLGDAHPVSCIDCHDPETMSIRVTRPGFIEGIAKLANSDDPVPHLPSIARWRKSGSKDPYDPNVHATRQEMRSFVCGQCHVEYYCANKMTLTFPWSNGLKVEDLEQEWEETEFPGEDGTPGAGGDFYDYVHKETGTKVFKAQHPEFELWSQGIHARAGVSCSDCHMPYEKEGATKVSSHWVRSPMLNINKACQTCHHVSESELQARVDTIQGRTRALMDRAAVAMTDMLDAIIAAQEAGASEEDLKPIRELQRKAMWRLDYISSENSKGFHADQEAARILGESIDYSRQAQAAAYRLAPNAEPKPQEVAAAK